MFYFKIAPNVHNALNAISKSNQIKNVNKSINQNNESISPNNELNNTLINNNNTTITNMVIEEESFLSPNPKSLSPSTRRNNLNHNNNNNSNSNNSINKLSKSPALSPTENLNSPKDLSSSSSSSQQKVKTGDFISNNKNDAGFSTRPINEANKFDSLEVNNYLIELKY